MLERLFSSWADTVSKRTLLVFVVSSVIFIGLSFGNIFFARSYSEKLEIWAPSDNPTIKNKLRSQNIFPQELKTRKINLIVESKGDNLLTVDAFAEMKQFQDLLYRVEEYSDTYLDLTNRIVRKGKGNILKFSDMCKLKQLTNQSQGTFERCSNSQMPLDFIYEKGSNDYDFDQYDTDEKLLAKIQSGKGDNEIFVGGTFLYIEGMFAEISPSKLFQQTFLNPAKPVDYIGTNDLQKAKAVQYAYYIDQARNDDINEDVYLGFEQNLQEAIREWQSNTVHANFFIKTEQGYIQSWQDDIDSDLPSVFLAAIAVSLYLILFLGSFSPIHCRCIIALTGITSVILSTSAAFGLLYFCNQSTSNFHSWLPFLSMSIGMEQFFDICHQIDKTSLKDNTAYNRVHEALSHAGPSITVTTLTTCIAFAGGMLSSLQALRSFCLFATVSIFMVYLCNMTFFLAVVVWDTRRVMSMKKECFGLCFCHENAIICCRGKFSQKKLNEFTGNIDYAVEDLEFARDRLQSPEIESAKTEIRNNTHIERCFGLCLAPILLSTTMRGLFMFLSIIIVISTSVGSFQIVVYFSQMLFISEGSDFSLWYQANDKYFQSGGDQTIIYVENNESNFNEIDLQNQIYRLNDGLQQCKDCAQLWHQNQSLQSWYPLFTNWVSIGFCSLVTPAKVPGMRVVVPADQFQDCLEEWLQSDQGNVYKNDISFTEALNDEQILKKKILGWRQYIDPIKIDDVYKDGPQYLKDINSIENRYGLSSTYSYSIEMITYEMYVVIVKETTISSICSVVAVMIVVFLMTGSIFISLLTLLTIFQIDIFLIALMPLWELHFNNVTLIHLVSSLGLSVLFSVKISHNYLLVETPGELEFKQQRVLKARVALSKTSATLFHAVLATLIAILIVGFNNPSSYIFIVFYKLWLGIVVYGMFNAFVIIPIILSLIGPTPDMTQKNMKRKEIFFQRMDSMRRTQKFAYAQQHRLSLDSESAFQDSQQVRLQEISNVIVPEPSKFIEESKVLAQSNSNIPKSILRSRHTDEDQPDHLPEISPRKKQTQNSQKVQFDQMDETLDDKEHDEVTLKPKPRPIIQINSITKTAETVTQVAAVKTAYFENAADSYKVKFQINPNGSDYLSCSSHRESQRSGRDSQACKINFNDKSEGNESLQAQPIIPHIKPLYVRMDSDFHIEKRQIVRGYSINKLVQRNTKEKEEEEKEEDNQSTHRSQLDSNRPLNVPEPLEQVQPQQMKLEKIPEDSPKLKVSKLTENSLEASLQRPQVVKKFQERVEDMSDDDFIQFFEAQPAQILPQMQSEVKIYPTDDSSSNATKNALAISQSMKIILEKQNRTNISQSKPFVLKMATLNAQTSSHLLNSSKGYSSPLNQFPMLTPQIDQIQCKEFYPDDKSSQTCIRREMIPVKIEQSTNQIEQLVDDDALQHKNDLLVVNLDQQDLDIVELAASETQREKDSKKSHKYEALRKEENLQLSLNNKDEVPVNMDSQIGDKNELIDSEPTEQASKRVESLQKSQQSQIKLQADGVNDQTLEVTRKRLQSANYGLRSKYMHMEAQNNRYLITAIKKPTLMNTLSTPISPPSLLGPVHHKSNQRLGSARRPKLDTNSKNQLEEIYMNRSRSSRLSNNSRPGSANKRKSRNRNKNSSKSSNSSRSGSIVQKNALSQRLKKGLNQRLKKGLKKKKKFTHSCGHVQRGAHDNQGGKRFVSHACENCITRKEGWDDDVVHLNIP